MTFLIEFHDRIGQIYHGTHLKNGSLSKSSGTFWLALICEKLQHWCSSTHLELFCTELLYEGQRWVQVLARATWWDRGKKSILSVWMVCNRAFLSGVCHTVLSEEVLTKRCQTTAGRDSTWRYKDSTRFFRTTDRDVWTWFRCIFFANTALDVPVEEFKVIMFRLYTGS